MLGHRLLPRPFLRLATLLVITAFGLVLLPAVAHAGTDDVAAQRANVAVAEVTLDRLVERRDGFVQHYEAAVVELEETDELRDYAVRLLEEASAATFVPGGLDPLSTSEAEAAVARAEQVLADLDAHVARAEQAREDAYGRLDEAVLASTWAAGQPGRGELLWPVDGAVNSPYGYRTHPISGNRRLHAGLDVAAPTGTPILAAAEGTVVHAGPRGGYGLAVIIDHGDGLKTLYAHTSRMHVSKGWTVEAGRKIAEVGSTGFSTGPHLHFEVRIDGDPVDPLPYYVRPEP